jgi:hypothetical protein
MIGRGLRTAPGKTDCLILDPMWISGENSFTPSDAFTIHPFSKGSMIIGSHDPLEAAEVCDRKAEEAMLARIAKEESKASAKEAKERGLVDLSVACAVFGYVLPPSCTNPATPAQVSELANKQIYAKGLTFEQAKWLIGRLKAREALGLATIKQVRKLQQFGIRGATQMSKDSASKAIGSDWRVQGSRPKSSKFSFSKFFSK